MSKEIQDLEKQLTYHQEMMQKITKKIQNLQFPIHSRVVFTEDVECGNGKIPEGTGGLIIARHGIYDVTVMADNGVQIIVGFYCIRSVQ